MSQPHQSQSQSALNRSPLWVDKYRPKLLDEIIIPDVHQTRLKTFSQSGKPVPPLFFHGGPGTGKTSVVYAFIHSHPDFSGHILSINGSDENDIGVVRDKIYTFATSPTLFQSSRSSSSYSRSSVSRGNLRFVVVDELDYMQPDAQRALKALVQTSPAFTCFCFICNYIHKVDPSLYMKCNSFSFFHLPQSEIISFIRTICLAEQLTISDTILKNICEVYKSDIRGMLYYLQYYHAKKSTNIHCVKWTSVLAFLAKEKNPIARAEWVQTKINLSGMAAVDFMTEYVYFLLQRSTKTPTLGAAQIEQLRTAFQMQHKFAPSLFIQTILDVLYPPTLHNR
jgi:DNA polymerase III delta prime subunit